MHKVRLFWAINLPEPVKDRLFRIQEQLKGAGADAKWVERENLHLTVQFLGDVEASRITDLVTAVEGSLGQKSTFSVGLGSLGVFPDYKRPRVLWVGVQRGAEGLQEIHRAVGGAMTTIGFPPEGRSFSPHLTLARIRSSRGVLELMQRVRALSSEAVQMGSMNVVSVDLMQSQLTRKGPIYTPLARVRLNGWPGGLKGSVQA